MDASPRAPQADSTLAFLRGGYGFIGQTCDQLGSDMFQARLMLRAVTCMRGPEATEVFYVPGRFTRKHAMPALTASLLQDFGSVQMLDGARHRRRKRMLLSLMTLDSLEEAREIFADEWHMGFGAGGRFRLMDHASLILCRTALIWCGLSREVEHDERRTAEFTAMIEGAGSIGLGQIRGQALRQRAESWARRVITRLRENEAGETTPARTVALATEEDGKPLSRKVAGVELINLLRPTVAVARFIVFAAHALHLHPAWRDRLMASPRHARAFAQEVRRFYPFFPAVGGRVLKPFSFRRHEFRAGDWVLLDLYGTNRHASWGDPERFRPERFLTDRGAEARLVAQGSGDLLKGHRCAGEELSIVLLSEACRLLAEAHYEVPEQDLSIPLDRFPTAPRDGFLMAFR
ncbi:cytochrome P450 [Aestuariivirga sp.]|uniref:cytochrome P450 n=1 Tax=Aestuariivirga sp. TaxID=2650926 RepID=UPI00391A9BF7